MDILNRSSRKSSACSLHVEPRSALRHFFSSIISYHPSLLAVLLCTFAALSQANAQDASDVEPAEPNATAAATPPLADKQNQVTDRYRKLEELLLRLADVEADENPERAALLRRAARQSRDTFVLEKLVAASDSLKSEQYAKAIESQGAAKEGLDKLLTLLLSEDRPQRIRDEKKRIANMIKELKVVERLQRSTRARTENGAELEDVSGEQSQISKRSEKVRDELKDEDEEPSDPSAEPNKDDAEADANEAESKEGPSKEDKEKEAGEKSEDGAGKNPNETSEEPSEGSESDSEKAAQEDSGDKPSEDMKSDEQKSGEQKSGEQSETPEQPQQPQSPEQQAESQLNEAIKEMKEAEKELNDAKRNEAVEKQRQAEEKLRAAIDRLEKILRQLREEEMQRELARLESRLRKMAQMQGKVLDDTKTLASIPESQRDRQVELRAGNLAFEEKKIVLEADRAMLLLREEGSSVAFPEVMAQMRGDMQKVAERLAATKVDAVTMGIQEDILAALEEMIGALQQAQRDLEKKKQEAQEGGQQGGGEQGEPPLVEQIAELKLIRTMETRIKSTTERYAEMIGQEPTGATDVISLIQDLSQRQNNLYRVTRDLVLKRNK